MFFSCYYGSFAFFSQTKIGSAQDIYTNKLGMRFVLVHAGSFTMGKQRSPRDNGTSLPPPTLLPLNWGTPIPWIPFHGMRPCSSSLF